MYNPQPDRSAEILAAANARAAEIQMQGYQSLGNSLASMGDSFAKAYTKASENKMTNDYLDGLAGQFTTMTRPDGSNYMDAETLEKFSKAPLGKKQGIITSLQAQADYDMKRWMYETQYKDYPEKLSLMQQQAANQAALRQPAANQVPMGSGAAPQTDTTTSSGPIFNPNIQTRRVFP